jgi:predicted nucleic-acid-binding protein
MKALDTNCLVRFLVRDDRTQAARIRDLFKEAEERKVRYLITVAVLLELLWVLDSVYDVPRRDILAGLEDLAQLPILEFERREALLSMIEQGRKGGVDLSDLLIGLLGKEAGCEKTLTFDRKAAHSDLFDLI